MKFGAGIVFGSWPEATDIHHMIRLARKIDGWGYDNIWMPDERLERNVYASLSLFASVTKRTALGTMVTEPYTRHPAVTAAAIATLDEISRGRAILGLGAGGVEKLRELCISREKPALTLKESVKIIRELLAGRSVTYEGRTAKLKEAQLGFNARPDIPIYVAGRGPKILQVAGEIANGAIIGTLTSKCGIHAALDQIERGVDKAKRRLKDITIVSWVYTSISRDRQSAKNIVRSKVASIIKNMYPSRLLTESGVEKEQIEQIIEFIKPYSRQDIRSSPVLRRQLERIVPDELVDKFSLTGTVEDVVEKVCVLEKLGIDQIAIYPFAMQRESPDHVIEDFAEVIDYFKCDTR